MSSFTGPATHKHSLFQRESMSLIWRVGPNLTLNLNSYTLMLKTEPHSSFSMCERCFLRLNDTDSVSRKKRQKTKGGKELRQCLLVSLFIFIYAAWYCGILKVLQSVSPRSGWCCCDTHIKSEQQKIFWLLPQKSLDPTFAMMQLDPVFH